MNYKLIIPAVAVTLGLGLTTTNIFAQETTDATNPMSILVQKIADKFSLNQEEVQAVFDEAHQEMHTQREAQYQSRLDQLVTDGKITADQKQLILDKHQEMESASQADFEAFKDVTPEERRAQMQAHHDEMQTWAEENGIDLQYLIPMGKGGHRGFGGPGFDQTEDVSES